MPARLSDIIAAEVRAERARQRLTQAQLAERLGWSPSTLRDLEIGRRGVSVNDLMPLCVALQLNLRQLTQRADPEESRILGIR